MTFNRVYSAACWMILGLLLFPTVAPPALAEELSSADLFPSDRVLDVQITLAEKDWDTIRNQSRNFFEALQASRKTEPVESPYTYVEAKLSIDGVEFPRVGIRKKGFIGSQSSSRPSLKIKLNYVDKQRAVDNLTNLTFNNNKQDPSLVSQYMGYRLFNAVGSPAPRCAFASVTVNGKKLGVYSHVESMRKPLFKREFGNTDGTLFEGTVVDFHEGWEGSFERKFGSEKAGRKHIKKLVDVVDGQNDNVSAIGRLVDLDSFYKFWAVEGLLGFWDGYSGNNNNFFVYLNPKTGRFHFLPWGADSLFDKYSKLGVTPGAPISVKTKGIVAHKLYQLESGRDRYLKSLRNLLEHHWDEDALLAEVDRIEAMLKPYLGPTQADHNRALRKVRYFIGKRRADILAEISEGMPIWTAAPKPPPVIPNVFARGNRDSIWNAAKTGNVRAVKGHLEKGAKINDRDRSGGTALSLASLAGQTEMVQYLISEGADVNTRNNDGNSALHGAAFLGRTDVVKLLLDGKASVNIRNNEGDTPLDGSSAEWNDRLQGMVRFIATIVRVKVDVEDVKTGRPHVAALLRKRGGKMGADLPTLDTADIFQSAKLGNIDALRRQLTQAKDDINGQDTNGLTALSWAALGGRAKAAEMLIAKGADVNKKNRDGGSPLHSAAYLGHVDVVALLLAKKAEVNMKNGMGETPLGTIADEWSEESEGILRFIGSLLKIRVDMEQVKTGRPKVAELLRKYGGKTAKQLD